MERRHLSICLCVLAVAAIVAAPAAATTPSAVDGAVLAQDEDDFPRAAAGVDQQVPRNASVLLDATPSFSPEGELVAYDWHITTPDGQTITPSCDSSDCRLARFRVPELGEYEVMLAIEDDEGRRMTDTLYVRTVPRGDYGIELTGPSATATEANLTATASPGHAELRNLTWYEGDRKLGNRTIPDYGGVFNRSAYIVPGTTYRVEATNAWNQTVTDTWTAAGLDTWVPPTPSSDEYPRIEGPALVTGDPDRRTQDHWVFGSASYVVEPGEFASITKNSWGVKGSAESPQSYEYESQITPSLTPGRNLVKANPELSFDAATNTMDFGGTLNGSHADIVGNVSSEAVLHRRVVVDPAPRITRFDPIASEESIHIEYDHEDRYNPVENVYLTVGSTKISLSNADGGIYYRDVSVDIPSGEHSETTARLTVVDGRGQPTTESTTVDLPLVDTTDSRLTRADYYGNGAIQTSP